MQETRRRTEPWVHFGAVGRKETIVKEHATETYGNPHFTSHEKRDLVSCRQCKTRRKSDMVKGLGRKGEEKTNSLDKRINGGR